MIKNDVKYVDFLSSGVRPEWGIVLWFQSDIPLKMIIEFVQPHLTITIYPTFSIPNDRRPELSWIKVACALQKLDQLFQGKTLQTVFFHHDISSQILQGEEQHSLIFEASNFDYFYICVKQILSWYLQFA